MEPLTLYTVGHGNRARHESAQLIYDRGQGLLFDHH